MDWRVVRAAYTEKKNAPKAILSAEKSWWFEGGGDIITRCALRYVLRTTQGTLHLVKIEGRTQGI